MTCIAVIKLFSPLLVLRKTKLERLLKPEKIIGKAWSLPLILPLGSLACHDIEDKENNYDCLYQCCQTFFFVINVASK